jgi:hypothetical protein
MVGGFFFYRYIKSVQNNARTAKIKEGWYVEILADYINVREKADKQSNDLGKVYKGEVYKVTNVESKNGNYWYKIEYKNDIVGWIANPSGKNYLSDNNNPNDIATPKIKFFSDIYYVDSIKDINKNGRVLIVSNNDTDIEYDENSLLVTDDRPEDVEVTFKVFHEVSDTKDQYWIQYTATDASDKSDSIVQKIVFNKRPSESDVYDFSELER